MPVLHIYNATLWPHAWPASRSIAQNHCTEPLHRTTIRHFITRQFVRQACPTLVHIRRLKPAVCPLALKMLVPKAPWSAVAPATAIRSNSRAAALLPHSMTLYAFSWYPRARQPTDMNECFAEEQSEIAVLGTIACCRFIQHSLPNTPSRGDGDDGEQARLDAMPRPTRGGSSLWRLGYRRQGNRGRTQCRVGRGYGRYFHRRRQRRRGRRPRLKVLRRSDISPITRDA
jgi:hypothetical protein